MAIAILHDAGVVTADKGLREIAEVCENRKRRTKLNRFVEITMDRQ